MRTDPSEPDQVTLATVRAALTEASVPHSRVWLVSPGVIRVDVRGWTTRARERASMAVYRALKPQESSGIWTVHLRCPRRYRWRPWQTWVMVSIDNAGLEWWEL